jgi:hypothetical protein
VIHGDLNALIGKEHTKDRPDIQTTAEWVRTLQKKGNEGKPRRGGRKGEKKRKR